LNPGVRIDSLEYAMAHPMEGAPGGPKPWSADRGYGVHRAHFLLPYIEYKWNFISDKYVHAILIFFQSRTVDGLLSI